MDDRRALGPLPALEAMQRVAERKHEALQGRGQFHAPKVRRKIVPKAQYTEALRQARAFAWRPGFHVARVIKVELLQPGRPINPRRVLVECRPTHYRQNPQAPRKTCPCIQTKEVVPFRLFRFIFLFCFCLVPFRFLFCPVSFHSCVVSLHLFRFVSFRVEQQATSDRPC